MFIKIFRPKWQHRNVQVRLTALRELEASDPVLLLLAREDKEPSVRQQAVRRIGDPHSLLSLLVEERDEAVLEACSKRLKRLLAGQEENLSLEQRLAFLEGCTEEAITAYVVRHADEANLRRAALAAVSRPSILAEVALNDPSIELRLAALERINRPATLERIVRQARGKDKQVSRRAREKLEEERLAELRPQRQVEISEAIEALVKHGGVDLVTFRRLQEEWDSLLPVVNQDVGQRYVTVSTAFEEAHARIQTEAALTAKQREFCERVEQLLHDLENDGAALHGMESDIASLQRDWESLEEELPNLNSGLKERFIDALAQTRQRLEERMRQSLECTRLQSLLEQLQQLVDEGGVPNAEALHQIEDEWQSAGGNHRQTHTVTLCDRFVPLMRQAQEHLAVQRDTVRGLQQEYGAVLGQMESALSEGQVKQAGACHDKLVDRDRRLTALGSRPTLQQQRRRKLATARLREFRDWRRFGTDLAREDLLEQMSGLQSNPREPLKQAAAIKALREAWRELDRKDGIAADSLRQAFEQAAEAAHAPCRDYYAEQAKQREDNLAARRDFIAELERVYATVDWQQPDWAALDHRLQQAQKSWPRLGGVERAAWQEVNKLFRQCIAAFEQHLSARRDIEKQRREALIRRVEALADEPDLAKALADTREAQTNWRADVNCPPRVEQALWRRFKAACDVVFARQKARANEQRREERERLAYGQQLCEQVEALVAEAQGQPEKVRSQIASLRQQWHDKQSPQRNKALEQRFAAAVSAFQQAEQAACHRQAAAERQLVMEKASLCDKLENLLFDPAPSVQTEQLLNAWQGLPVLQDARLEQALLARFNRALGLVQGGADHTGLEAIALENLRQKEMLCLQLEILAGLDSPVEYAEARLGMQVELLSAAMTGQMSETESQSRIQHLIEDYFTTAPIPPGANAGLKARVETVLNALANPPGSTG